MRIFAIASLIIAGLFILPAAATAQQDCQQVQFPHGAYTHSVQGYANPQRSTCYYLDVRPGQEAQGRILEGPVFLTTSDTSGQFTNVQFYTQSGRLFVYVHTDYAGYQQFLIQFTFV